jgi:transcriptional regulator with XRE-family HTH domain
MSKSIDKKRATRSFTNKKPVDGSKLRSEFMRLGLTTRQIADKVGYNQSTISNWCTENEISMPGMKALELAYGIKYEDIMFDDVKEEQHTEAQEVHNHYHCNVDYDKLYQTIYSATYEAVKRAWNEPVDTEKENV